MSAEAVDLSHAPAGTKDASEPVLFYWSVSITCLGALAGLLAVHAGELPDRWSEMLLWGAFVALASLIQIRASDAKLTPDFPLRVAAALTLPVHEIAIIFLGSVSRAA